MTSKYLTIPAVVAGALGMGGAIARAAEPTTAELMQQIQALQSKVQTLETQQSQAITSKDVDATVDSVLKDADKRSQLMAMEGFTAGWNDGHFVVGSADGNFKIMPSILFQFRNNTTYRNSGKASGSDDMQNGFEVTRARLAFAGNAFNPDMTYKFSWLSGTDSNSSGSSLSLENAWVQYKFGDDWSFRAGQYKDNVWHEETVDDGEQLAVDRSLVNQLLGGGQTDYVQGVKFMYDNHSSMRAEIGYHDGYNSDNTSYVDSGGTGFPGASPTNFGFSGRFEFAASGGFKGYDQFTSNGDKEDVLVFGAGGDWSQANSTNLYFHTVDVQWNPSSVSGLSMYAAYLGVYRDRDDNGSYDWGFVVQAGYMINPRWEVFGRGSYTAFDDENDQPGVEDDPYELTGGVNYYLVDSPWHNHAKVTVDLTWLPKGSGADSELGYLSSPGEDEIVIRGQFTLQI